jgi:DNA-binding MarR family transcriptional regulator
MRINGQVKPVYRGWVVGILVLFILSGLLIFKPITAGDITKGDLNCRSNNQSIISNNTTWTLKNSPYVITDNTLVEINVNLTIEPGVIVKFNGGKYLRIDGTLYAVGTESKMIRFTSNLISHSGIRFEKTSKDSIFKYCEIEYTSGISGRTTSIVIGNNTFKNNFGAIVLYSNNSVVYNNKIIGNQGDSIWLGDGVAQIYDNIIINNNDTGITIMGSKGYIERNYISNNRVSGINIVKSEVRIKYNYIENNGGGIGCQNSNKTQISYNFINNNKYSGIESSSGDSSNFTYNIINNHNLGINLDASSSVIIRYNNITNVNDGIKYWRSSGDDPWGNVKISNNNILNIKNYFVFLNDHANVPINVSYNWWGTTDSSVFDKNIHDYYDDFDLGKVIYKPFLTSPENINLTNVPLLSDFNLNDTILNDNPNNSKENNILLSSSFKIITISVASFTISIIIISFFISTEIGKYAFFSALGPLYTKNKKHKNPKYKFIKGSVRGYILGNPGESYNAIKRILELPNGTLAYHLKVLEREGSIRSEKDGMYRRFYPTEGNITKEVFDFTNIQEDIHKLIKENPGISQKELSLELDTTLQRLNYQIQQMVEARIIRVEKVGKFTRCYVLEEGS